MEAKVTVEEFAKNETALIDNFKNFVLANRDGIEEKTITDWLEEYVLFVG